MGGGYRRLWLIMRLRDLVISARDQIDEGDNIRSKMAAVPLLLPAALSGTHLKLTLDLAIINNCIPYTPLSHCPTFLKRLASKFYRF